MAGVGAMREHREGRLTLRTHHIERLPSCSKPGASTKRSSKPA
jgi:hypothetical protein